VLMTLQTSFLLPPFGYALMMARGALRRSVEFRPMLRALLPFLVAQWLVLAVVLLFPQLVHIGQSAADISRAPAAAISDEELNRRLEQMLAPPPDLGIPRP